LNKEQHRIHASEIDVYVWSALRGAILPSCGYELHQ
jgi:hypothetical protein